MIIVQQGAMLLADIEACDLPAGRLAFWWLGQHSYIVKLGTHVLYMDPYLSPSPKRNIPPLLKPDEVHNAFLFFGSHDHSDHIDHPAWPTLAAASPKARFVIPSLHLHRLSQEFGISEERFVSLDAGDVYEQDGITIHALASAHEFLNRDLKTGEHPFLGFLVKGHGCTFYHSGDTCMYEGLTSSLELLKPHVMFLPINGRDAERYLRGCIGNMTYQEAVDLAGTVRPALVLPAHFDMFNGNLEDPNKFIDYLNAKFPDIKSLIPGYGERVEVACT